MLKVLKILLLYCIIIQVSSAERNEILAKITDLVLKSLVGTKKQSEVQPEPLTDTIFSKMLKLISFGPRKMFNVTIDVINYILKFVTNIFKPITNITTAKSNSRPNNLNLNALKKYLMHMKDLKLIDYLINDIKEQYMSHEIDCVLQFLCWIKPIVSGMQMFLFKPHDYKSRNASEFILYLPKLSEFQYFGKKCEQKYPYCNFR